MADLTGQHECLHCGRMNPAQWSNCPDCGLNPWQADTVTAKANPSAPLSTVDPETTQLSSTAYVITLPDFSEITVLPGERLNIGRETDNPTIDSAVEPYLDVSRTHLSFEALPTGLVVTDVGSTYGTWLEDHRLEARSAVPLVPGQRLRLGKNCYVKVSECEH